MEPIEIAKLKDEIVKYLSNQYRVHIPSEIVYKELQLENIPKPIFKECLNEMERDDVIHSNPTSGERAILMISDKGKKLLFEGGYMKRLEQKSVDKSKLDEDNQIFREKTELEIANLKTRLNHFQNIKSVSVIAIIISFISLLVSIF